MAVVIRRITLQCTTGGSDKEYIIELAEETKNQDYLVNFAYGRRGGTMKSGTKTPRATTWGNAMKILVALQNEKIGKGYLVMSDTSISSAGQTNPRPAPAPAPAAPQISPQLANAISKSEMDKLMHDSSWHMQEKKDGERRPVRVSNGQATGFNRKGMVVALPPILAMELSRLPDGLYDGKQIGSRLFVFDAPSMSGGWSERMAKAAELLKGCMFVSALPVAVTLEEKRAMLSRITADRGEGVVFKRYDSLSQSGRPNSGGDWLKFKLVETATVLITGHNNGKRSVSMAVFNIAGFVDVGNVTIPSNHALPAIDSLCEVAYLYYFEQGSLFQPVFKGLRTDLDCADSLDSLKRKQDLELAVA